MSSSLGKLAKEQARKGQPGASLTTLHRLVQLAHDAPAAGAFGNSGRNSMIGPGSYNLDSSVFKIIPIHETIKLQFRAEMFNTLNHANFSNPVANISSATVGQILSATAPRIMQFGLRLTF
ncbi:MAG: hypothetical protein HYX27_07795 [Acidobacteria bacterium]|nr:hypothetical protein [Acidobacteriota bacterium]